MSILVDSPIWSLALRRATASGPHIAVLSDLIARGRALIIGAVRQEVLSGLRERIQFERIRDRLRPFPDIPLTPAHYERAAEFYNMCRSKGIQGSQTDFLVCAVADLDGLEIFTTDHDFDQFATVLPIRLALNRG